MKDKQFDHIIKNKLSGFESQSTPDWGLFANKKQALENTQIPETSLEDIAFDAEVNASLQDFKTQIHTPQWDAFLSKKADHQHLIEHEQINQAFDAGVKAELDSYQPQVVPQWDTFLKQYNTYKENLEPEVADEDTFDQDIRVQLEAHQMDVQPQWDAFKDLKAKADGEAIELNKHKDFDEAVRASVMAVGIDQLSTSVEPDWAGFKSKMSEVNHFDESIKETLEPYQSNQTPDWSAFKTKQAEVNQFDEEIEETISEYQSEKTPDWNAFLDKKKRADSAVADAHFDKGVSGSVQKASSRYNSQHWQLLRERLRRIAALKKNILSYKGLEVAFVLLMLLTFGNHFDGLMHQMVGSPEVEFVENNATTSERVGDSNTDATPLHVAAATERNINTTAGDNKETILPQSKETESNQVDDNKEITAASTPPMAMRATNNSGWSSPPSTQINTTNSNSSSHNAGLIAANDEANATLKSRTKIAQPVSQPTAISKALLAGLDALAQNEVAQLYVERNMPTVDETKFLDDDIKKTYKDEGSWIHLYAAIENNYIHTPFNVDAGLPGRVNDKNGYSFEAIYSRVIGAMEYEAGIGYNLVNYTPYGPNPINYEDEFFNRDISFNKIKLDMLSIPLRAKYHFISNGRWSVFGSVGITNEIILQTRYGIQDEIISPKAIDINNPPPPGFDLPWFYERAFTTGVFGDKPNPSEFVDIQTKSNIFILRGALGIGAERNLSDNLSAYMRADYYPTLYNSEIGPYNDKIDKIAIGMGFKLRIK